jgi:AcrR family transcriptional regulator
MTARAAAAAATRERIVRAAAAVYARDGFRNASTQAVARQADVSPNTVLNHFPDGDALLAAVVARLLDEIGLPAAASIAAAGELAARVTRLAAEVAACYGRGEKWWEVFSRDRDLPALRAGNAEFFRRVELLVRAALGPGRRDRKTVAVVMALIGPPMFYALRGGGMSPEETAATTAELLASWLERRNR